jgi:NTP pyrophosphatase (non-canonical NTP hydrolase)
MSKNFIADAIRTESPVFNPVNDGILHRALLDFVMAANALDQIKKAIFYGKTHREGMNVGEMTKTVNASRRTQRLFHAIVGLATEAGELVEILHDEMYDCTPIDITHLIEELGDTNWYQAIAYDELGVTVDEVQDRVIAKLKARFPDRFEEARAIHRDVEVERRVLEAFDVVA